MSKEKPRKTRDSLSFSSIEVDRVAVHRRNHHHDHRHGRHVMLDATPGAILEARVTSPPTRHGRDKPPKMADSLGFRRQVKLTQLHLFSTCPCRFIAPAAYLFGPTGARNGS
jgi:hypothetical protein